jgi:hypothetical protein
MRVIERGDVVAQRGRWHEWRGAMFRTAILSCPSCGKLASLASHEILASGRVMPVVRCPHPSCGWEDAVRLDGWEAPS